MIWLFLFLAFGVTYPRLSKYDGTVVYDFNRDAPDIPTDAILWDDLTPILWDDSTFILWD